MTRKLVKQLCTKQNVEVPQVLDNLEDFKIEEEVRKFYCFVEIMYILYLGR